MERKKIPNCSAIVDDPAAGTKTRSSCIINPITCYIAHHACMYGAAHEISDHAVLKLKITHATAEP